MGKILNRRATVLLTCFCAVAAISGTIVRKGGREQMLTAAHNGAGPPPPVDGWRGSTRDGDTLSGSTASVFGVPEGETVAFLKALHPSVFDLLEDGELIDWEKVAPGSGAFVWRPTHSVDGAANIQVSYQAFIDPDTKEATLQYVDLVAADRLVVHVAEGVSLDGLDAIVGTFGGKISGMADDPENGAYIVELPDPSLKRFSDAVDGLAARREIARIERVDVRL